jgi:hypothetical protein
MLYQNMGVEKKGSSECECERGLRHSGGDQWTQWPAHRNQPLHEQRMQPNTRILTTASSQPTLPASLCQVSPLLLLVLLLRLLPNPGSLALVLLSSHVPHALLLRLMPEFCHIQSYLSP